MSRREAAGGDLLFEIGVEELPAGYVPPALEQLERGARAMLAELRLACGGVRAFGTPRRLVAYAEAARGRGLNDETPDLSCCSVTRVKRRCPARQAALDECARSDWDKWEKASKR